jgi:hypothetical protein
MKQLEYRMREKKRWEMGEKDESDESAERGALA